MALPTFTDLVALAAELEKKHKRSELRKALDQAWRAQSCLADLRQVADCCQTLEVLNKQKGSGETIQSLTIERSLLATAISLYARATSTSGKQGERGSIQLDDSKLTADQRIDHKFLINVRNQAMAHVYSSKDLDGTMWHADAFFAFEFKPGHWKPASGSKQIGFHKSAFEKLSKMCSAAIELIQEKHDRRMAAVAKIINDGVSQNQLNQHRFDPVALFGSAQAVMALVRSSENDHTRFWVNE